METFDLDEVHGAVKTALRIGAIGFDAIKHLVLCRVEKRPPVSTLMSILICHERMSPRRRRPATCA